MYSDFEIFLNKLDVFPVLGKHIIINDFVAIDLSVDNLLLSQVDVSSSHNLETFVWQHLETHKSKVAFGGYLEKRNIYNRSDYFNKLDNATARNIHLGIDLWIEAGSPIYAPLEGEIHSYKNNTNFGDYGPTIIIKHYIESFTFYTLYGHLSLESISNLEVGRKIAKGAQIATLGTAEVNGDYPPHLHFQIIKDIEGYLGDYPGVCSEGQIEYYKANCPNPNALLRLF